MMSRIIPGGYTNHPCKCIWHPNQRLKQLQMAGPVISEKVIMFIEYNRSDK